MIDVRGSTTHEDSMIPSRHWSMGGARVVMMVMLYAVHSQHRIGKIY